MLNKLILFLIRKKLHLSKDQFFSFKNQTDINNCYFFSDKAIIKCSIANNFSNLTKSHLSVNFLLSKECDELISRWSKNGK